MSPSAPSAPSPEFNACADFTCQTIQKSALIAKSNLPALQDSPSREPQPCQYPTVDLSLKLLVLVSCLFPSEHLRHVRFQFGTCFSNPILIPKVFHVVHVHVIADLLLHEHACSCQPFLMSSTCSNPMPATSHIVYSSSAAIGIDNRSPIDHSLL